MRRVVADQIAASNFVSASLDDGEVVAVEVADEKLTAVGLERELNRQLANVEVGQAGESSSRSTARDLVRARTGDEDLAVVGQDDEVLRLLADGDSIAHRQLGGIDDRDGVVRAIAGDDQLAIGRNPRQSGRAADANRRDHGALRESITETFAEPELAT